jgi:hypothetical protein
MNPIINHPNLKVQCANDVQTWSGRGKRNFRFKLSRVRTIKIAQNGANMFFFRNNISDRLYQYFDFGATKNSKNESSEQPSKFHIFWPFMTGNDHLIEFQLIEIVFFQLIESFN